MVHVACGKRAIANWSFKYHLIHICQVWDMLASIGACSPSRFVDVVYELLEVKEKIFWRVHLF
uniref:Uncharacterized protein n=1 Tax=Setaria italica TaxID=4555 RepID=K3ZFE2_SETIT